MHYRILVLVAADDLPPDLFRPEGNLDDQQRDVFAVDLRNAVEHVLKTRCAGTAGHADGWKIGPEVHKEWLFDPDQGPPWPPLRHLPPAWSTAAKSIKHLRDEDVEDAYALVTLDLGWIGGEDHQPWCRPMFVRRPKPSAAWLQARMPEPAVVVVVDIHN